MRYTILGARGDNEKRRENFSSLVANSSPSSARSRPVDGGR